MLQTHLGPDPWCWYLVLCNVYCSSWCSKQCLSGPHNRCNNKTNHGFNNQFWWKRDVWTLVTTSLTGSSRLQAVLQSRFWESHTRSHSTYNVTTGITLYSRSCYTNWNFFKQCSYRVVFVLVTKPLTGFLMVNFEC